MKITDKITQSSIHVPVRRKMSSAKMVAVISLLFLMGLLAIPQFSDAAFSEPGTTPLLGAPPTFLNGSTATQTKLGSILIGPNGGSALLCLNADTGKSIHDPANAANCIDAWSDLASIGFFVRRQQNTSPSNPLDPTTYGTADRGFATVIGDHTTSASKANPQGISTVVTVNTGATAPVRYAVYATDSGVNTRSAAQLSGKTLIQKAGNTVELCLNGQCIDDWSKAYGFGNAGIIRLQNTTTLIPDIGNASISGAIRFSRGLTVGRPTDGTPTSATYGDGQCTDENGEDSTNSPNDCN